MLHNIAAQAYFCQQMATELIAKYVYPAEQSVVSSYESQSWLEERRSLWQINGGGRGFLYLVSELL